MHPTVATIHPPPDFEPMHIGEHAALDFLNSVLAPSGELLDFLHDGATMARWLTGSGVVPDAVATAAQGFTPRQLDRLAAEARELREWFRALVLRWSAGGARTLRAADLDHLNALMARSPTTRVLVRGPAGFELHAHQSLADPHALTAELAAACADLLTHQSHDKVHKCENPNCTMLFADNKRGPKRRWCSMAVCGNRMKVAAHRARQRELG
jgi:predicted RNA-binding Zn ribbon-like protein